MGIIIMGTPLAGRTTLGMETAKDGVRMLDIDNALELSPSEVISLLEENVDRYDIIGLPYSYKLMMALDDAEIDFDIFYHGRGRRIGLLTLCAVQRRPFAYSKEFDNNFENFFRDIEEFDSPYCHKHRMDEDGSFIGTNSAVMDYVKMVKERVEAEKAKAAEEAKAEEEKKKKPKKSKK